MRNKRQVKVGLPVEVYVALCIFAEEMDETTSAVVVSFIVHGRRRKGVQVKSILHDEVLGQFPNRMRGQS